MQLLARRFTHDLKNIGYENYAIFLQTRNWDSHPIQRLNRSGVEDLARSIKQFLVEHKPKTAEQSSTRFNLDDFPRYVPLAGIFEFLLLTKLENPQVEGHLDNGSVVQVGVTGYQASEMALRLEEPLPASFVGRALQATSC
jgi:hypothetical protein